jgi:hypothetical protein
MPLELGIFLGAKFLGDPKQRQKACLVFDEQPHRYRMYLSDVAGQDICWHSNDPKILVSRVRDWLSILSGEPLPSGSLIWDHYTTFRGELRHSCELIRQKPSELTHVDFLHHARSFKIAYVENLIINEAETIENPKSEDVRRAIRKLESKEDNFLVLEKGANRLSYIQAYHEGDRKWVLEYQDGHLDEHFKAMGKLDSNAIVRAFQDYRDGDDAWRSNQNWRRIEV